MKTNSKWVAFAVAAILSFFLSAGAFAEETRTKPGIDLDLGSYVHVFDNQDIFKEAYGGRICLRLRFSPEFALGLEIDISGANQHGEVPSSSGSITSYPGYSTIDIYYKIKGWDYSMSNFGFLLTGYYFPYEKGKFSTYLGGGLGYKKGGLNYHYDFLKSGYYQTSSSSGDFGGGDTRREDEFSFAVMSYHFVAGFQYSWFFMDLRYTFYELGEEWPDITRVSIMGGTYGNPKVYVKLNDNKNVNNMSGIALFIGARWRISDFK